MAGNCKRGFAGFTGLQGKQTAEGMITFDDNPMTGIVGRKYDPVWGSMRAERSLLSILGADKAKMYTRLALMNIATKDVLTPIELAKSALVGGTLTQTDINRLIVAMERAPFSSRVISVLPDLVGQTYLGRVIRRREPSCFAHLVKRVLSERQWAPGTTEEIYNQDIRSVLQSQNMRLVVYRRDVIYLLAFAETDEIIPFEHRGLRTQKFVGIFYAPEHGTITTGYQFSDLDRIDFGKDGVVWLTKPK